MEEFVAAIAPVVDSAEGRSHRTRPGVNGSLGVGVVCNKRLALDQFERAVDTCHRHGLGVLANISLGTAFLSPGAAIGDAERAVRWAMAIGVDACVVFPMQVREWTLLSWLWRHALYEHRRSGR